MPALDEVLNRLRHGGMVIVTDHADREDEGDLVIAAEFATPEAISFMAAHGRGLICLPMTAEVITRLRLPPMAQVNEARRSTAFTVSIEARHGISTGISAHDRARTIAVATAADASPETIAMPGHIFPLRSAEGGVLARPGHTEASVDLMKLAGLGPAAVICEIMGDNGEMLRGEDLKRYAADHGLPVIAIDDIIRQRLATEILVEEVSSSVLPSEYAETPLRIHAFRSLIDGTEHIALVNGPLTQTPLVRIHSECVTGEAFGSLRCDCGAQLQTAIATISREGGAVIYLRNHEGRGIGLANKIRAYALQDEGQDTVEANETLGFVPDARSYAAAAHMLKALGVQALELMTNNPAKVRALQELGLQVAGRRPLSTPPNPHNLAYMKTKRARMGHIFN